MDSKKLLLLLPLMLVGCDLKPEVPKYHYDDCVEIKNDFYGVTYGRLLQFHGMGRYSVLRKIGPKLEDWSMDESNFKKVDKSFCSEVK